VAGAILTQQFQSLVKAANRILVTSHISPDPDAVCSVLLMGRTLQANFPDKQIQMVLEENTSQDLSFLGGYSEIKFAPVFEAASDFKPDLVVIVDGNSLARVSRNKTDELSKLIHEHLKSKVAVIDHHPDDGSFQGDIYINEGKSSTAQQIYELCFEQLDFQKPEGYAKTALLGILRDTSRFKYDNPDYKNTFRIVSQLIEAGASIEQLEFRLNRFTKDELVVLAHLLENATDNGKGYTYSFIDDQFAKDWQSDVKPDMDLKAGCDIFTNQYLRNLDNNFWGFVVYPELLSEPISYSASFRSVSGGVDVSQIAAKLGGGGHKQAAGAKNIRAESILDAIATIEKTISLLGLIK